MTTDEHDDDEIIATLSDYLDGALPVERKNEVETKLASDDAWKQAHAELVETRNALSGLQKARAPASFAQEVTQTIHKRSAGRFFARRTLGDRVPFGVLLIVALLGLGAIAYVMWSSSTGSLKVDRPAKPQKPNESSESVIDTP
ncbi:MAG: anti-sigma factor [Kofleriaceae bacterium]